VHEQKKFVPKDNPLPVQPNAPVQPVAEADNDKKEKFKKKMRRNPSVAKKTK